MYDYKRYAILYVDDEEKSLKYFTRAFGEQFRILTASSAQEGYKILEEHKDEIGLLMTDQRMPGEKGVQFLERARQLRPRIVRVLATAYSDLDAAIDAVNAGSIYKYITKPWDIPQLETTLKRGLEFFIVQRERDQLLAEKLSVLHNMMIADRVVSLGIVAAGLGHYVRNSLVAVRTFLDLAPSKLQEENVDLEELRNPNFWKEFHDRVQHQVKRITELLGDLGAAAKSPPFQFQDRVELSKLVDEVTQQMEPQLSAAGIQVNNRLSSSLPALQVDLPKFRRFFELLLQDEVNNLAAGCRIEIDASCVPADGQPESLKIMVRDNGGGLPEEALRSVFDPFFVRNENPKEFGLNLMTCYFIVYHHGGTIEVKSSDPSGTVFQISVPLQPVQGPARREDQDFIGKVLLNESLWEKLLAGY